MYSQKDKSALAWRPRGYSRSPYGNDFIPYVDIWVTDARTGIKKKEMELCRETQDICKPRRFLFWTYNDIDYSFVETEIDFRERIRVICERFRSSPNVQNVLAVYTYPYDAGFDSWELADYLVWRDGKWM